MGPAAAGTPGPVRDNPGSFRSSCGPANDTVIDWGGLEPAQHSFTLHLVGYPDTGQGTAGPGVNGQAFVHMTVSVSATTSSIAAFVTDDTEGARIGGSRVPACAITSSVTPTRTPTPPPTRTITPTVISTSATASVTATRTTATPTPTPTTSTATPTPSDTTVDTAVFSPTTSDSAAAVAGGSDTASGGSLRGIGLPGWLWAATILSVGALVIISVALVVRHRREPAGPDADLF